jgi:ATPase subunit of ABC transporter with duplicated ATPase domains
VEQMRVYTQEQDQIKTLTEFIAKNGHGYANMAKQSQSKEKIILKMERAGLTKRKFSSSSSLFDVLLSVMFLSFGCLSLITV